MPTKIFTPTVFTIKIANKPKRISKKAKDVISCKCLAVVDIINGEYKAIVNYENKHFYLDEGSELINDKLLLPFTEESLSLRDKERVWLKEKDKYGHDVCIIRDSFKAHTFPGVPTQYNVLKKNLLISGYIVRRDNKMYFEYEDVVKYNYLAETSLSHPKIDSTQPLFKK